MTAATVPCDSKKKHLSALLDNPQEGNSALLLLVQPEHRKTWQNYQKIGEYLRRDSSLLQQRCGNIELDLMRLHNCCQEAAQRLPSARPEPAKMLWNRIFSLIFGQREWNVGASIALLMLLFVIVVMQYSPPPEMPSLHVSSYVLEQRPELEPHAAARMQHYLQSHAQHMPTLVLDTRMGSSFYKDRIQNSP